MIFQVYKTGTLIILLVTFSLWCASCKYWVLPLDERRILPTTQMNPVCVDMLSIVNAFYNVNDTAHYEESLSFFTDNAIFDTWATGAAGYKMAAKHYEGKEEIRHILGNPGMRRKIDEPDSPIYSMVEVEVAGNTVTFRFEPDRKRPDGKSYHAYRVTFTFNDCKIAALEVIELVYWL